MNTATSKNVDTTVAIATCARQDVMILCKATAIANATIPSAIMTTAIVPHVHMAAGMGGKATAIATTRATTRSATTMEATARAVQVKALVMVGTTFLGGTGEGEYDGGDCSGGPGQGIGDGWDDIPWWDW